jgi:phosphatidylinositol-bisphosphatase
LKIHRFFFDLDITKSCDFVFWGGDLNFRIDLSHDEVLECCKRSNYNDILLKDEFRILQQKTGKKKNKCKIYSISYSYIGDAYANFKEGEIDFPPTYKFDLRVENAYAKHRTPSYTVRIRMINLIGVNILI